MFPDEKEIEKGVIKTNLNNMGITVEEYLRIMDKL